MAKAYKGICEITLGQTGGILTAYGPTIGVNVYLFRGWCISQNQNCTALHKKRRGIT